MATPQAAISDDFTQWKKWVEDQLRLALSGARSRPRLNVTDGDFNVTNNGAVKIFGSGGLTLVAPDGTETFSARGWTGIYNTPTGDPQPMVTLRRDDDSIAFLLGDPLPLIDGYSQFWAWYDRLGHIVAGDDITTGFGLARPYIPLSIITDNQDISVTSGTFVRTHSIAGSAQHPRLQVPISVGTGAATTGEVRLYHPASGTVMAGPTTVPAGGVAPFYVAEKPDSVEHMDWEYYEVQARRVTGVNTIIVRCYGAEGLQT